VKGLATAWKYEIIRGVYPETVKERFFAALRMTSRRTQNDRSNGSE
jgi:hypothetical protein